MAFEDDPKDEIESYPCDCGGEISKDPNQGGVWQCNKCDWMPPQKETD